MFAFLCKYRPHKWKVLEQRTYDFGMRSMKIMQRRECQRCGQKEMRGGYLVLGETVWDEGHWDSLDEQQWEEAAETGHAALFGGKKVWER